MFFGYYSVKKIAKIFPASIFLVVNFSDVLLLNNKVFKLLLYENSVKFWLLHLYTDISLFSFFVEIIILKNGCVIIFKGHSCLPIVWSHIFHTMHMSSIFISHEIYIF